MKKLSLLLLVLLILSLGGCAEICSVDLDAQLDAIFASLQGLGVAIDSVEELLQAYELGELDKMVREVDDVRRALALVDSLQDIIRQWTVLCPDDVAPGVAAGSTTVVIRGVAVTVPEAR